MKNTLASGVPLAIVLSAAVATAALRAAAKHSSHGGCPALNPSRSRPRPRRADRGPL